MATLKVGRAEENGPTQTAKQTWYVDADGNPTTESANAAHHIAEKGKMIMPDIVRKYGFVDGDLKKKGKAEEEVKKIEPTENKAKK